MPQINYSASFIRDLERLRAFLSPKNPAAAKRAGQVIVKSLQILAKEPQAGRPIEDMPEPFREWPIKFGDSGYIARYRIEGEEVIFLRIGHQREAGY